MLKLSAVTVFFLLSGSLAQAADIECNGKGVEELFLSVHHSFQVAGTGRLYFHTAPDARCIDKKVFVIPGDSLDARTVSGDKNEWVSVTYLKKNGEDVSGWVRAERLMFTGASGMNMTPEKAAYYTEAARKARDGKLGLP